MEIALYCYLDLHRITCAAVAKPQVLNNAWFEVCRDCSSDQDMMKLIATEMKSFRTHDQCGLYQEEDSDWNDGIMHDMLFGHGEGELSSLCSSCTALN